MGNAVPRLCHDAAVAPADGARSCRNVAGAKAAGGVLPGRVATARRPRGGRKAVRRRGGVEEEHPQQEGGGGGITVARVKMVLTRKEAEKLIARLEDSYGARERRARMAELTGQLRAGDGGRTPETWTPRLAPIQEN